MALSAQIAKVSIKHDAILDFLVANPTLKRSEVAGYFGVTVPWLSTIIHSCAFQDLLKQRQDLIFDVAVVQPIRDKLMGAANMAAEKLMEALTYETDTKTLNTVLDTTLANLGYGQKTVGIPVNQQNNFTLNITKEDLAGAREMIGRVKQAEVPSLLESLPAGVSFLPPSEKSIYVPDSVYTQDD